MMTFVFPKFLGLPQVQQQWWLFSHVVERPTESNDITGTETERGPGSRMRIVLAVSIFWHHWPGVVAVVPGTAHRVHPALVGLWLTFPELRRMPRVWTWRLTASVLTYEERVICMNSGRLVCTIMLSDIHVKGWLIICSGKKQLRSQHLSLECYYYFSVLNIENLKFNDAVSIKNIVIWSFDWASTFFIYKTRT